MDNEILLILAARGGSKGVKNKNLRELCGKPLIAHSILQARNWGRAGRIICSTDSPEIGEVAKQYGAEVPFVRPAELANDTAGKLEVLRHALKEIEKQSGRKYPIVMDLDATAPIRRISDLEGAYLLFIEKRPKSVFSVTPARKNPYFNMVEINGSGWAVLVKPQEAVVVRRQDVPPVYDMNASIYVYDREYLLTEKTRSAVSDRSLVWVMDEWSAFDIDQEADFQFIEFLASRGLVSL